MTGGPTRAIITPGLALGGGAACASLLVACSLIVSTSGLAGGSDDPKDGGGGDAAVDGLVGPQDGDSRADSEAGPAADILLTSGRFHSCAAVGGRMSCWGNNTRGQLGDGTKQQAVTPVRVKGLPGPVSAIGAGYMHTCAIVAGEVWCWGDAGSGALGPGGPSDSALPLKITGIPSGATSVGGGDEFTCALVGSNVYCWGSNYNGRLADGQLTNHAAPSAVIDASGTLENVSQLSVGGDHSCALLSSPAGAVVCWGHSDGGALGNAAAGSASPKAVRVEGLPGPAQSVSIAGWHACALVSGSPWCWGTGGSGQLGNGNNVDSVTPVPASASGAATLLVAAGGPDDYDATCIAGDDGFSCWGAGKHFRLGDGQTSPRATPQRMSTLPASVVRLTGGDNHWCAALSNGELRCWGQGDSGQLGNGKVVDQALPVVVSGLP